MNKYIYRLINMNLSNNKKIMIVTSYSSFLGGFVIYSLEHIKNNYMYPKYNK